MTLREKSVLALQVLRESMAFCWHNGVLWDYVGLFFFVIIAVGGGMGLLSYVLGKTIIALLTIALFASFLAVILFWIVIAFLQKVTALLHGRSLLLRESFNVSSQFIWQFVIGMLVLSFAYSFCMILFKLVPATSMVYWFLLPIGLIGYWIALVAALFNPILFSDRTSAFVALKKSMIFVWAYWDIMTITYAALILAIAAPLILLVKIMHPIIFITLTVLLLPFVLLWIMYAFLLMSVFWFVFYNNTLDSF